MKILFVGDIVAKPGRAVLKHFFADMKQEYNADFVIVNGENMTHGKGMMAKHVDEMFALGIDAFTGGNHSLAQKDFSIFDDDRIIRPLNFSAHAPGRGMTTLENDSGKLLLVNLIGTAKMGGAYNNPFETVDTFLQSQSDTYEAIIVDFHAELTAEKYNMRAWLDGRVSALLGTHTHVPTADAHITDQGMGYITDIGMCGAVDSSIGVVSETTIPKIAFGLPSKFAVAENKPYYFRAVFMDIEDMKCRRIELVQRRLN